MTSLQGSSLPAGRQGFKASSENKALALCYRLSTRPGKEKTMSLSLFSVEGKVAVISDGGCVHGDPAHLDKK
jgi:hypothetical protein